MPNHRLISLINCYRLFLTKIIIVFLGYVHVYRLKGLSSPKIFKIDSMYALAGADFDTNSGILTVK